MRSMFCLAPNISSAFKKDVTSITVMLGFVLDGVFNVQNFINITVFADPVVNVFTDVVELKTSTLTMSVCYFIYFLVGSFFKFEGNF